MTVSGSVEALEDALVKIVVSDEVQLRIIHRGVGAVTQDDVNLAERVATRSSSGSTCGPRVESASWPTARAWRSGTTPSSTRPSRRSRPRSRACSSRIYEEVELGSAEIREVFRSSRFGNIAGCIVRTGLIRRNSKARLLRDGAVVSENLTIAGLRRFKDDATEVREGFECGITLGNYNDIQLGDVIETWEMREKPRG